MAFLLLNVALAAVPSVVLVVFFYRRDSRKPEPIALVWRTFLLGFLSLIPAVVAEQLTVSFLVPFGSYTILVRSFIVAGLIEESSKFLVVRLFIYNRREFDEVADGIVYTITAGLGFAFFENILYSAGPTSIVILRGFTAVPLHAVTAGILGYYIGRSRFLPKPIFLRGILLATLVHGLYDLMLFSHTGLAFFVIPLLVLSYLILARLWNRALALDREAGRS